MPATSDLRCQWRSRGRRRSTSTQMTALVIDAWAIVVRQGARTRTSGANRAPIGHDCSCRRRICAVGPSRRADRADQKPPKSPPKSPPPPKSKPPPSPPPSRRHAAAVAAVAATAVTAAAVAAVRRRHRRRHRRRRRRPRRRRRRRRRSRRRRPPHQPDSIEPSRKPGQQAGGGVAAEVAAGPRRVGRAALPVRHPRPPPRTVRMSGSAPWATRSASAAQTGTCRCCAAGRRPLDVGRRRAVRRVEEARRPAHRQRLAGVRACTQATA